MPDSKLTKTISLKTRILIPLTLIVAVFIGTVVFIDIYNIRHKEIAMDVKVKTDIMRDLFMRQWKLDEELMVTAMGILSADRQIRDAWLSRDRAELLKLSSPLLDNLDNEHKETQLSFYDNDRVNFLRVDDPQRHGDTVDRFTINKAGETGTTTGGIEIDSSGTLILRVVYPWRINDRIEGYIEASENIEYIIEKLRDIFATEICVAAYKNFLDRKDWERKSNMLVDKSDWDLFRLSAIVYQSKIGISNIISDYMPEGYKEEKDMITDLKLSTEMIKTFEVSIEDQPYRIGFIPVKDAGNREIGGMVILHNVKDHMIRLRNSILNNSVLSAVGGMALFVLFSKVLWYMEEQLESSRHKLMEESRAREVAQKKYIGEIEKRQTALHKAHDELETRVMERTADLSNTNEELQEEIAVRKKAEEELARYRDQLEVLVKERTTQLETAHKELVIKERLAVLGQLTATVSHEIRNPLGTVRTSVFSIGNMIEQKKLEDVGLALKLAERNIIRCDRIIEELLDFSRVRGLDLELTAIDDWLEETLLEQVIPEHIELTRELSSGIKAPIDKEYFRRVIVNLVSNAIQALQDEESQGNRLLVKSSVAGGRLEIHIIDTGVGIPHKLLDKIFEPLFSTKGFGIGLGIPIVKNIMQQHGGGVEYRSRINKGTTVTLWVPLPETLET